MERRDKAIRLAGFSVFDDSYERASSRLRTALDERAKTAVFFANTHFVVTCQPLRSAIEHNPVVILNDGIGLTLGRVLLAKGRFTENLNGTDFVPRFLRESQRPLRLFLLGAVPDSVKGATEAFNRIRGVEVVGSCDGYSVWQREATIVDEINAAKPDILLVALGCPLQERWTLDHLDKLDVPLTFAIGALLDFMSGHQVRAPQWFTKMGIEWAYRLCREPRRLAYRYTVEIAAFLRLVLADTTEGVS